MIQSEEITPSPYVFPSGRNLYSLAALDRTVTNSKVCGERGGSVAQSMRGVRRGHRLGEAREAQELLSLQRCRQCDDNSCTSAVAFEGLYARLGHLQAHALAAPVAMPRKVAILNVLSEHRMLTRSSSSGVCEDTSDHDPMRRPLIRVLWDYSVTYSRRSVAIAKAVRGLKQHEAAVRLNEYGLRPLTDDGEVSRGEYSSLLLLSVDAAVRCRD